MVVSLILLHKTCRVRTVADWVSGQNCAWLPGSDQNTGSSSIRSIRYIDIAARKQRLRIPRYRETGRWETRARSAGMSQQRRWGCNHRKLRRCPRKTAAPPPRRLARRRPFGTTLTYRSLLSGSRPPRGAFQTTISNALIPHPPHDATAGHFRRLKSRSQEPKRTAGFLSLRCECAL